MAQPPAPEKLADLAGQLVTIFSSNCIYEGRVVGVDGTSVTLNDPLIIPTSSAFTAHLFQARQRLLNNTWTVLINTIESFGVLRDEV